MRGLHFYERKSQFLLKRSWKFMVTLSSTILLEWSGGTVFPFFQVKSVLSPGHENSAQWSQNFGKYFLEGCLAWHLPSISKIFKQSSVNAFLELIVACGISGVAWQQSWVSECGYLANDDWLIYCWVLERSKREFTKIVNSMLETWISILVTVNFLVMYHF